LEYSSEYEDSHSVIDPTYLLTSPYDMALAEYLTYRRSIARLLDEPLPLQLIEIIHVISPSSSIQPPFQPEINWIAMI
jgi:2-hydroxy-3-keto-5-methylthiopentenyl-1-phosphate phosphatase